MRLGVVWANVPNANYRAVFPMQALEARGHTVVWPRSRVGEGDPRSLAGCDVVHVYRRLDQARELSRLIRAGIPITYDNDDDLTKIPKESPDYKAYGGFKSHGLFTQSVKMARMARVCTTTNEVLAEKYRNAGVERVEIIPNYLSPVVSRPRVPHEGLVVGWLAGLDHAADIARIPVVDALDRVLAKHPSVRVDCIGVDLGLGTRYSPGRYRHDLWVDFSDLNLRMGGWDIGIAPLADMAFNRARSDIKLKEYAALGLPWLASPVGPYVGLEEAEGGRLVGDDGWFEALDRLVTRPRDRRRLARKGSRWAKSQTLDLVADRWERLLEEAATGYYW